MGARTIIVIVLSLICGISAATGVHQLRLQKGKAPAVKTVPVVIAAVDIGRSVSVTENIVKIRQWPEDLAPEGAFMKIEDVLERASLVALISGEPLVEKKLAPIGSGYGMAALIKDGMRAYSIPRERKIGLSRFRGRIAYQIRSFQNHCLFSQI